MSKKIYTHIIHDAGHGWYRFSKKLLKQLVPEAYKQITPYSFMSKRFVYAEEDVDAPLILNALRKKGMVIYHTITFNKTYSKIRNLPCFEADNN